MQVNELAELRHVVSKKVGTPEILAKYLTSKVVREGTSLLDKRERRKVPYHAYLVRRYLANYLVSQLFC